MTNDERNKALAEMIGPAGYENSRYCQQGHRTETNILMHNGEPSDVCARCLPAEYIYEALTAIKDPAWHPEWRITQQPKDFSRVGVLEPLARKLLEKCAIAGDYAGYGMDQESYAPYEETRAILYVIHYRIGRRNIGYGTGYSYEYALGEALLSAHRTIMSE